MIFMDEMLELHEYDTGKIVYVRPKNIIWMRADMIHSQTSLGIGGSLTVNVIETPDIIAQMATELEDKTNPPFKPRPFKAQVDNEIGRF